MMRKIPAIFITAATAFSIGGVAHAVPVVGGDTRVLVAGDFAGLVGGVTGTASVFSVDPLIANFPVTGGTLDGSLAGTIRHDGSGIILTNGVNVVGAGNFVIDTVQSLVFGDVTLNGAVLANGLGLFSFDLGTVTVAELTDLSNPVLGLFITAATAGALTAAFGVPDLTGVQFGAAATAPALGVVPEVGTWAMLIAGFGLVGAALRRRRPVTA